MTDTQALIERLTPCTEDALMTWLEAQLLIDRREYEHAVHEAKTFSERIDYDWSPFASQWSKSADHFANVVGRWLAIKAVIADRNEWKEQHENLLSVRQSDLATLTTALTEAEAKLAKAREAGIDTLASLVAAISLLERGGKAAKLAAPSDRMFDQMIKDYKASVKRARACLAELGEG